MSVAVTHRAEGGFEPLDFYIPAGLKPAPRTLQAHPRLLNTTTISPIYAHITYNFLMEINIPYSFADGFTTPIDDFA